MNTYKKEQMPGHQINNTPPPRVPKIVSARMSLCCEHFLLTATLPLKKESNAMHPPPPPPPPSRCTENRRYLKNASNYEPSSPLTMPAPLMLIPEWTKLRRKEKEDDESSFERSVARFLKRSKLTKLQQENERKEPSIRVTYQQHPKQISRQISSNRLSNKDAIRMPPLNHLVIQVLVVVNQTIPSQELLTWSKRSESNETRHGRKTNSILLDHLIFLSGVVCA